MAILEKKSLSKPEQYQEYEKGKAEVVMAGGLTFARITTEPGWKWSKHQKPLEKTESCIKAHLLYMVSGKLHVRMDDGKEEEFGAGDIAVIPPGHDVWTAGDEPAVVLEISH